MEFGNGCGTIRSKPLGVYLSYREMSLYHLSVTLHLLAALFWLGGMFFLAVVAAPILRDVEPTLRADLFQQLGVRFRTAGWIAIAVLLLTGVANLHFRGWLEWALLSNATFRSSALGRALAWKIAAVAVMVVLSALHDFVVGPAASRARPGSAEAVRLRRWSIWIARLNAVVGIALVAVAIRLARGGG